MNYRRWNRPLVVVAITYHMVLILVLATLSTPLLAQPDLEDLRRRADEGYVRAQYNLALMYDTGQGVPEDNLEAVRWYRKAADQGNVRAQNNLGVMYDAGEGVPEDNAEAVRWYRMAAEQGDASAQYNLGVMYDTGEGVPEDDEAAVRWYREAGEQGDVRALHNLGLKHSNGRGAPQDRMLSYMWFDIVASRTTGSLRHVAMLNRDQEKAFLTPVQVTEAQQLAREWNAAHPREP